MLVFSSPNLFRGRLDFALSRNSYNQYALVYTRAYGMAERMEAAFLNFTTPLSERLELSAENRPLIWLDSDIDRTDYGPPDGMLVALLAANPTVIKATGRTKMMHDSKGVEREASEVEILLNEEDLSHICYYCGEMEFDSGPRLRMERCSGQGYHSLYWCGPVSLQNMIQMYDCSSF
jgi:hypothetical protein